jgi:hypothetical protein
MPFQELEKQVKNVNKNVVQLEKDRDVILGVTAAERDTMRVWYEKVKSGILALHSHRFEHIWATAQIALILLILKWLGFNTSEIGHTAVSLVNLLKGWTQ